MTWAAHSLDDDDVMSIASLKLKIIQLAAGFAIERGSKKQNEKLQFFPLSHFIFTQNFRFCTHFHLHVQPIRIADCMCACARMIAANAKSDICPHRLVRSMIIYSKKYKFMIVTLTINKHQFFHHWRRLSSLLSIRAIYWVTTKIIGCFRRCVTFSGFLKMIIQWHFCIFAY